MYTKLLVYLEFYRYGVKSRRGKFKVFKDCDPLLDVPASGEGTPQPHAERKVRGGARSSIAIIHVVIRVFRHYGGVYMSV